MLPSNTIRICFLSAMSLALCLSQAQANDPCGYTWRAPDICAWTLCEKSDKPSSISLPVQCFSSRGLPADPEKCACAEPKPTFLSKCSVSGVRFGTDFLDSEPDRHEMHTYKHADFDCVARILDRFKCNLSVSACIEKMEGSGFSKHDRSLFVDEHCSIRGYWRGIRDVPGGELRNPLCLPPDSKTKSIRFYVAQGRRPANRTPLSITKLSSSVVSMSVLGFRNDDELKRRMIEVYKSYKDSPRRPIPIDSGPKMGSFTGVWKLQFADGTDMGDFGYTLALKQSGYKVHGFAIGQQEIVTDDNKGLVAILGVRRIVGLAEPSIYGRLSLTALEFFGKDSLKAISQKTHRFRLLSLKESKGTLSGSIRRFRPVGRPSKTAQMLMQVSATRAAMK